LTLYARYRNGGSFTGTMRLLYAQGGVTRFYSGISAALLQAPLSRFGDTAANTGVLSYMDNTNLATLPVAVKTAAASSVAALWRVALMPIDTVKTVLQVEGKHGFQRLQSKIRTGGVPILFHGSVAALTSSWVSNFPWFYTFNSLQAAIPKYDELYKKILRNAFIGFVATAVSDTVANSIRVTKVVKQASPTPISYPTAVREVLAKDGLRGLFFRGLQTRLIANGLQGMISV